MAGFSPVRKCQPFAPAGRPYLLRYVSFFAAAIFGVSFGSKLRVTTSYSSPMSKLRTLKAATAPLSTCVQSIGHS